MTTENFCYWLKGFIEIQNPETLTKEQIEEIKNHLDLVFTKVTPDIDKYDGVEKWKDIFKDSTGNPPVPPYTINCENENIICCTSANPITVTLPSLPPITFND